jgi:HK97 family phage prohead protease
MSTTETEPTAAEQLLVRTFAADITPGDGRTAHVRIVPYGVRATAADGLGGLPKGVPYEEEFVPGCFAHQFNAANRVVANLEHQMGVAGIVGRGMELSESGDGTYGVFRFLDHPDGEKALELVREGVFGGISVEAKPGRSVRTSAGVVQRVKAHMRAVAFCREPAYAGAEVLAIREDDNVILDEELLPKAPDPDVIERLQRLGVAIPDRYLPAELTDDVADVIERAFTEQPWDGSASRWDTAAAYCASSAIDLNTAGEPKTKDRCHLPFKEPGSGDVNVNALRAALSRLGQGDPQDASQAQRDAARVMLERLLARANQAA